MELDEFVTQQIIDLFKQDHTVCEEINEDFIKFCVDYLLESSLFNLKLQPEDLINMAENQIYYELYDALSSKNEFSYLLYAAEDEFTQKGEEFKKMIELIFGGFIGFMKILAKELEDIDIDEFFNETEVLP